MKVNVKGTMLMCHAAVDAFRRRSSNGHPADSAAIVRAHTCCRLSMEPQLHQPPFLLSLSMMHEPGWHSLLHVY
jgi:hypothetical protein